MDVAEYKFCVEKTKPRTCSIQLKIIDLQRVRSIGLQWAQAVIQLLVCLLHTWLLSCLPVPRLVLVLFPNVVSIPNMVQAGNTVQYVENSSSKQNILPITFTYIHTYICFCHAHKQDVHVIMKKIVVFLG